MREIILLAAYAIGAFSFPIACGAIAEHGLNRPAHISAAHTIAGVAR